MHFGRAITPLLFQFRLLLTESRWNLSETTVDTKVTKRIRFDQWWDNRSVTAINDMLLFDILFCALTLKKFQFCFHPHLRRHRSTCTFLYNVFQLWWHKPLFSPHKMLFIKTLSTPEEIQEASNCRNFEFVLSFQKQGYQASLPNFCRKIEFLNYNMYKQHTGRKFSVLNRTVECFERTCTWSKEHFLQDIFPQFCIESWIHKILENAGWNFVFGKRRKHQKLNGLQDVPKQIVLQTLISGMKPEFLGSVRTMLNSLNWICLGSFCWGLCLTCFSANKHRSVIWCFVFSKCRRFSCWWTAIWDDILVFISCQLRKYTRLHRCHCKLEGIHWMAAKRVPEKRTWEIGPLKEKIILTNKESHKKMFALGVSPKEPHGMVVWF